MSADPSELFWRLAAELQAEDPRVVEGTIMNGRCLRVGREFLALVDFKGSGLVVKLPAGRVAELIAAGVGRPFAPAGKVFAEWVAIPTPDRRRWSALLREGVAFVGAVRQHLMRPENSKDLDFRRFLLAATSGMQAICRARFEAFGSAGRASAIKPMGCDKMAERYRKGDLAAIVS